MEYPKRFSTHICESDSLDILSKALPSEWIVRELTERDYGIDLYVEMVLTKGYVTGELIALQVKSTNNINFDCDGNYTLYGIKRSTLNYWEALPVPAFVFLVDLTKEKVYWCGVERLRREGRFNGNSNSISLVFNKDQNLSEHGLNVLTSNYLTEKRWKDVEDAIEKALMSYDSLGPLVLMCRRKSDKEVCSTAIQYMLITHYKYYTTLSRYLLQLKPKYLPHWYTRSIEVYRGMEAETPSLNFSYKLIKEMLEDFIRDYRECIIYAYDLVTKHQVDYFSTKMPYLVAHLKKRPYTFYSTDWFTRYYYDEYENETLFPEKLFFEDFDEFDADLADFGEPT